LIQTPTGRAVLVDGGPSANRLSNGLGRRLPLTHREIDYLVVAGVSDEQLGALPQTLERFPTINVLWSGSAAGSYSARDLRGYLAESGTQVVIAQPGQRLDLGEGAVLQVLGVNRGGAILSVEWGRFSALLPVSMDFESMDSLMHEDELGPVTALLLAESGYAPVNTRGWIDRWKPRVVLLSVAADDPDGRPDLETMAAVEGYTLLRTDLNGWIELTTNSEQMWVEVEKNQ
jgi:competence protein ComEC